MSFDLNFGSWEGEVKKLNFMIAVDMKTSSSSPSLWLTCDGFEQSDFKKIWKYTITGVRHLLLDSGCLTDSLIYVDTNGIFFYLLFN